MSLLLSWTSAQRVRRCADMLKCCRHLSCILKFRSSCFYVWSETAITLFQSMLVSDIGFSFVLAMHCNLRRVPPVASKAASTLL